MIINPNGMRFDSWADAINQQLGMFGFAVKLMPGEEWIEWAYRLILLPVIQKQNPPRPGYFESWDLWADAFNRTVVY